MFIENKRHNLRMKTMTVSQWIFWICLVVSIGLCIAGFILPPSGVIDPSVLTAVGELLGFASVAQIPYLAKDHNVEIHHGDTTIKVTDDDEKTDEDN